MPTNRTKRTRGRTGLDCWKIDDLVNGDFLLAGTGYGELVAHGGCGHWSEADWATVHNAARDDWREHGAEFMAWWRGQSERFTTVYARIGRKRDPSITPWALTKFGEPTA